MADWKNLDTLASYQELAKAKGTVNLKEVMAGESGADRVKTYTVPIQLCGKKC